MDGDIGATPELTRAPAAQTARMEFLRAWHRWLARRLARRRARAVRPPPDPADCGTAWGLDLTLPPAAFDAKRSAPRH